MLVRIVSLFMICLIFSTAPAAVSARSGGSDSAAKRKARHEGKLRKHGAKIIKAIKKLGASKNSIVEIKLRDKSKIRGSISEITESNFTVISADGSRTVVEYPNAKQVKGKNLSSGAWIAIGFGLAMAVFGTVILILVAKNG